MYCLWTFLRKNWKFLVLSTIILVLCSFPRLDVGRWCSPLLGSFINVSSILHYVGVGASRSLWLVLCRLVWQGTNSCICGFASIGFPLRLILWVHHRIRLLKVWAGNPDRLFKNSVGYWYCTRVFFVQHRAKRVKLLFFLSWVLLQNTIPRLEFLVWTSNNHWGSLQ